MAKQSSSTCSKEPTIEQLDPQDAASFARMGALCRALPCWSVDLGDDLDVLPRTLDAITAPDKPDAIAVIIPVRDGATFPAAAIDSILARIGGHVAEILVVDDGSRDESAAIGAATFIDWVFRARDAGVRFCEIDAVVLGRRVHGANLTLDRATVEASYLMTLRRHFARQRAK